MLVCQRIGLMDVYGRFAKRWNMRAQTSSIPIAGWFARGNPKTRWITSLGTPALWKPHTTSATYHHVFCWFTWRIIPRKLWTSLHGENSGQVSAALFVCAVSHEFAQTCGIHPPNGKFWKKCLMLNHQIYCWGVPFWDKPNILRYTKNHLDIPRI